jgi:hypothetical protein
VLERALKTGVCQPLSGLLFLAEDEHTAGSTSRSPRASSPNKTTIDSILTLPNFLDVLSTIPQMKEAFEDFSNDEAPRALLE